MSSTSTSTAGEPPAHVIYMGDEDVLHGPWSMASPMPFGARIPTKIRGTTRWPSDRPHLPPSANCHRHRNRARHNTGYLVAGTSPSPRKTGWGRSRMRSLRCRATARPRWVHRPHSRWSKLPWPGDSSQIGCQGLGLFGMLDDHDAPSTGAAVAELGTRKVASRLFPFAELTSDPQIRRVFKQAPCFREGRYFGVRVASWRVRIRPGRHAHGTHLLRFPRRFQRQCLPSGFNGWSGTAAADLAARSTRSCESPAGRATTPRPGDMGQRTVHPRFASRRRREVRGRARREASGEAEAEVAAPRRLAHHADTACAAAMGASPQGAP